MEKVSVYEVDELPESIVSKTVDNMRTINSVTIDVYRAEESWRSTVPEYADESLADCLRDFMRWIYRELESEYEYQTSHDAVLESIRANRYQFTENGTRI